jgi:hypothetical protein
MAQPECNGATGQCFGGAGCFADADCASQAGCGAGACVCQIESAPPGVCRVRPDECQSDADCRENGVYVGKFCTLNTPPRRCLNAPGCTTDADCLADGLVCDTAMGSPSRNKCVNGTPCPTGNECSQGQVCASGVCVAQNCLNTPSLCRAGEACDPASLRCVPQQGGPCSNNADCAAGTYCNGISCVPGCRDNADCAGGVCNAQNQCEQPSGGVCGPCASDADCPGGSRCVTNPVTGAQLCQERCSSLLGIACTVNPMATCLLGNCSCIF